MADALGTPGGVVSDEDHRLAMAGMITPQTSTLAVRTGVLVGPGIATALVTGTSATGTMTYSIAAHHAVTTRGTGDGVYLGPTLEAATTVNTTAAPGANSRIDIIWGKQNDTASTISPDSGTAAPLYGVASGTAAASPVAPTIPVGAVELGRATVAVGATSTNGAGVTISQTAQLVSARGARVWCRSLTERNALTQYAGLEVYRIDNGTVELSNGTSWVTAFDPALKFTRGEVRSTSTNASGQITVTHGLGTTPKAVTTSSFLTYSGNDFSARVYAKTSTTFSVACFQNNTLLASTVFDFDWVAFS